MAIAPDRQKENGMSIDEKTVSGQTATTAPGTSRRSLLRGATVIAGGAVIFVGALGAARAQSGKMSQEAAAYQSAPKNGQKCLDCSFFVSPSSCKLVDGTISPVGWCKFYAKKAS
jgi:hypothetical protein